MHSCVGYFADRVLASPCSHLGKDCPTFPKEKVAKADCTCVFGPESYCGLARKLDGGKS